MRQRSCQTALRVARVPRGIRAMPAKEKPRVSRGDDFCFGFYESDCFGSAGFTHTVLLLVNMTMPGLAPAGFFTYFTGT